MSDTTILRSVLSKVQEPLAVPGLTELCVNTATDEQVLICTTDDGWKQLPVPGVNVQWVNALAQAAGVANGNKGGDGSIMEAVLPGGLRAQFVFPPNVATGTSVLCVRTPARKEFTLDDLSEAGLFDRFGEMAHVKQSSDELLEWLRVARTDSNLKRRRAALHQFFETAVREGRSIFAAGPTNFGKTAFINALAQYILHSQRVVSIESVAELKLGAHPNWVQLLYDQHDSREKPVTPSDLIITSLRLRPDILLIGEFRGGEAWDLARILLSGHGGPFVTGHASSVEDAFNVLTLAALQHPATRGMEASNIKEIFRSRLDIVVVFGVERGSDGSLKRYIADIDYLPEGRRFAGDKAK